MAFTYRKIQSVTVSASTAAAIEFTSIPQTYTDLVVFVSARTNQASNISTVLLRFNGSTSSYTDRIVDGDGTNTNSNSDTSIRIRQNGANATASTFGNAFIYVPNYAGSTNKSVSSDAVSENNATQASQTLSAGLWSNTSVITSVAIVPASGSLVQHSTATLYGILQA